MDSVMLSNILFIPGEDMNMVKDESVDVVVISLVLCSVQDTAKILQEVKRVLRPVSHLPTSH